jgi:hypothetical protein
MTLAQPGTLTGKPIFLTPTSSSGGSINLPSGVAVTSGWASGDVWNESGVLKLYNGTATKTIAYTDSSITGSAAKWTSAVNLAGNSVDGSTAVAFANKFIVQGTTDAGLSGAQFLGALSTGIVKNTTTTGVLSIAVAGTDYLTPTAGASSVLTKVAPLSSGTAGYVKVDASGNLTSVAETYTRKYAENNGALTATSGAVTWTVTHNLNTSNVTAQIYQNSTNASVEVDVVTTSANVVTLTFNSATLAGSEYRVVVIG